MLGKTSNEQVKEKVAMRNKIREELKKLGYQADPMLVRMCDAALLGIDVTSKVGYPAQYWAHIVIANVWEVWHNESGYNIEEMVAVPYLEDPVPADYPYPTPEKCEEKDATVEEAPDMVNHPPHYNQGSIETIDLMEFRYGTKAVITYCTLNVDKYLSRAPFKGKKQEDEDKAMWYYNKALELDKKLETGEARKGIVSFLDCKSCQ